MAGSARAGFVVDASVWVAAFDLDDVDHADAAALVVAPPEPLLTIDLALYEVANVVSRWPDAEVAAAAVAAVEVACLRLIRVTPDLAEQARELSSTTRLTAYDAAYVVAARAERCRLVSLDRRDLVGPGFADLPGDSVTG